MAIAVAIAVAAFGVVAFSRAVLDDRPPDQDELTRAVGHLEWFERGRTAARPRFVNKVRFRLTGYPQVFQYVANAGDLGTVEDELSEATGKIVEVLYDADESPLNMVYDVAIEGQTISSYEQVARSWEFSRYIGAGAGILMISIGIFVGRKTLKGRVAKRLDIYDADVY